MLSFNAYVFGADEPDSEILKKASPVNYVTSKSPPFLCMHGELDQVVPYSQSLILHEALLRAGVSSTLVPVKNAGHGFRPDGGEISPDREEIIRTVGEFFDRHLKKFTYK